MGPGAWVCSHLLTLHNPKFSLYGAGQANSVPHSWSAVVRGAVAKGLQMGTGNPISIRKCRRHYGVSVSQPFSSFKHAEENVYVDPFDGERKSRGQMIWLLKKGDALFSNQPKHASIEICRKFGLKDSRVFQTNLIACDYDDAPKHYAEATNRKSHTRFKCREAP